MTVDAERVRQRQRHLRPLPWAHRRRVPERLLGIVAVVEVALHVQHLAGGDGVLVEVVGRSAARHAEVGVHRALGIRRDDDDAPAGRRLAVGTPGRNATPTARRSWPNTWPSSSSHTLPMYAARPPKLATPHIVLAADPPLISTAEPERPVQLDGPVRSRPASSSPCQGLPGEERVGGVGDDVDEGVADPDDVEPDPVLLVLRHGRQRYRHQYRDPVTTADAPVLDPYRLPRAAVRPPLRRRAGAGPRYGEVQRARRASPSTTREPVPSWCSTPSSSTSTRSSSTAATLRGRWTPRPSG